MAKKSQVKKSSLSTPQIYFLYLFVVWTLYRILFIGSDFLDEVFVKPVTWLLPLFFILAKESVSAEKIGITSKKLFSSIYQALALGLGFAFVGLIANIAKYRGINFEANLGSTLFGSSLLISLATAVSEELVFRGYLLKVLLDRYKKPAVGVLISAFLWTILHVPISYFVWEMSSSQIAVYLSLTFLYGIGSAVLYLRTKNIISPILLHVFWEWPIILFR